MKKTVSYLAFSLLLFSKLNAQQVYVQGGLNLANITNNKNGNTEKNNTLPSFNTGLMYRFGLSHDFDLETGLLFTGRGSKAETYFNGKADYVKTRFNPYYLEMPLNALFKLPLSKSANLVFSAGPYAAIGIAGKSTRESKVGPLYTSSTSNIKFSNDDPLTSEQEDAAYDKLKRFDFGLNAGVALELRPVYIKAGFGLGLTKINSTQSNNSADEKNKYRTFNISVGIPLGK